MAKLITCTSSPNKAVDVLLAYIDGKHEGVSVENGPTYKFQTLQGKIFEDINFILRHMSRNYARDFCGASDCQRAQIDHWLEFSNLRFTPDQLNTTLEYLNKDLSLKTFLVGNSVTIGDMAVFSALSQVSQSYSNHANICRYMRHLESLEKFQKFADKPLSKGKQDDSGLSAKSQNMDNKNKKKNDTTGKDKKVEGKFVDLPGAKMGEVCVRFPPEASGYLHVGHAKAALLNQYYKDQFKGRLVMRFDDTNPDKENSEYEKVILEDIKLLGLTPDIYTFTSDSFQLIIDYCEQMIMQKKAYVDDTDAETMRAGRETRTDPTARSNSVEQNLSLWRQMEQGTEHGRKCCVRAKIDMKSNNGCLRDPTMYRCKVASHPRTANKFNVYPTYDFSCPIVDSVEGITHALRTTEYHDRDDQYNWFIDAMGLRKPHIYAYSRFNLQNTLMSKRKLTWIVDQGLVSGWDDPRLPTVRGVVRHGMTIEALKMFIVSQGSSRSVVMMEWDKIWATNKKVIDPVSPRYTALPAENLVKVTVDNAPESTLKVALHPKNASMGEKNVYVGDSVLIDQADAVTLKLDELVTFINWGNLRITAINKTADGTVTSMSAKTQLDNKDYKKTTKLTWLPNRPVRDPQTTPVEVTCVYFDNVISKAVLGKDDDFKDFINKDTKFDFQLLGDSDLAGLKKGSIIQLQRRGYFICDQEYQPHSRHSGRCQPCVLFNIPDGSSKQMPLSGSKHKETTTPSPASSSSSKTSNYSDLLRNIDAQGTIVRDLKAAKATKDDITAAVKVLLSLKEDFTKTTGQKCTPELIKSCSTTTTATPPTASSTPNGQDLLVKIDSQGAKVRELKSAKATKDDITAAVKVLLALKEDFTKTTGQKWTPELIKSCSTIAPSSTPVPASSTPNGQDLLVKIDSQGAKVRELKSAKASKDDVTAAVKVLLALKEDFTKTTGQKWTPELIKSCSTTTTATPPTASSTPNGQDLLVKIDSQGAKVRELKSAKANKDDITAAVKVLLALKEDFTKTTGQKWTPELIKSCSTTTPATPPTASSTPNGQDLLVKIDSQGSKVRELKSAKANKETIDSEVKILLALKADYKSLTGKDAAPSKPVSSKAAGDQVKNVKPAKKDNKKAKKEVHNKAKGEKKPVQDGKKITRLGLEVSKQENLSDWYAQVITKSEMIDYYNISGCYVLRQWSYAIWEVITRWFDYQIKEMGFENVYFPMFVSKSVLDKEKDHIEDFAPEVAWVTKSGESELAEPIALRPTSETVMYPSFAKWVQSHRDLPIKVNQWCNVVRWEFKNPQPFLRTREFLWQEGHSAHQTKEVAVKEVHDILTHYRNVYEHLMAIPVVPGRKTEKEKFAGGDFTTTIEAFISASGRGIQAATSHHLGQNFSKMFDISFENPEQPNSLCYAYQNSWGLTTRTIGVLVMVHGDDKGLVMPPRVAPLQVVIIPVGITASLTPEALNKLMDKCQEMKDNLKANGIRCKADLRDNYSPGWKFNHWELKGVPLRVELGPRELAADTAVLVKRYTGLTTSSSASPSASSSNKQVVQLKGFEGTVQTTLDDIQEDMFASAKKDLSDGIKHETSFDKFCTSLDNKKLILSPFCGEIACEDDIKTLSARDAVVEEGAPSMGAKALCIPFEQPKRAEKPEKCVNPNCKKTTKSWTLFGRSY